MQESVRLQKYLAEQGVASRRNADRMILEGRVEVDGEVAEPGTKVIPGKSVVKLDGRRVLAKQRTHVTLALHKPKGYLCSHHDPHHQRTVFELLPLPLQKERLLIAGRLDLESEGLLILTNDGDLAQRLTHPTNRVIKRYRVELDRTFSDEDRGKLLNGISWEGERLKVERVITNTAKGPESGKRLEVHLDHGKKREIRRLFYALGYDVRYLQRFQIGQYSLKGLSAGAFQVLGRNEIRRLLS
ncbi:MAG: pseudouridine synthase [Verrucomicrobiota bacterium JB022]|nr:pseudouridine synthase [Verrucomicrobiota bacterium JB022]